MREKWLNDWPRSGNEVLADNKAYCAGCGKFFGFIGAACIVVPEDYEHPDKLPDWPFEEDSCPVCCARPNYPVTASQVATLDWKTLREAFKIKKGK